MIIEIGRWLNILFYILYQAILPFVGFGFLFLLGSALQPNFRIVANGILNACIFIICLVQKSGKKKALLLIYIKKLIADKINWKFLNEDRLVSTAIWGDTSYPDKTRYILDACQSVGQMKLNVQKLGCVF